MVGQNGKTSQTPARWCQQLQEGAQGQEGQAPASARQASRLRALAAIGRGGLRPAASARRGPRPRSPSRAPCGSPSQGRSPHTPAPQWHGPGRGLPRRRDQDHRRPGPAAAAHDHAGDQPQRPPRLQGPAALQLPPDPARHHRRSQGSLQQVAGRHRQLRSQRRPARTVALPLQRPESSPSTATCTASRSSTPTSTAPNRCRPPSSCPSTSSAHSGDLRDHAGAPNCPRSPPNGASSPASRLTLQRNFTYQGKRHSLPLRRLPGAEGLPRRHLLLRQAPASASKTAATLSSTLPRSCGVRG